MEVGIGVLGLAPAAFWAMTEPELAAAVDGFRERHGGKAKPGAMTRAELLELMAEENKNRG